MKRLITLFSLLLTSGVLRAGTLFIGAYPDRILVFDEAQGKVVDQIHLVTGLPRTLRASADKKTIYISTNDHDGFEVLDVATRKIVNHFVLDDATHRYRVNGGAPDPQGKLLYASTIEITKKTDRFEIGKPKYTVIDLAQQKIVKTVDQPASETAGGGGGGGRGGGAMEVSPDGKYIYQFGQQLTVLNSSDFSVVEKIDLAQPEAGMENLGLGGLLDALSDPTQRITIFNSSDPIVHNKIFGIAKFDLNTRKFDFTPIGPAPVAMTQIHVTPDRKMGFTVTTNMTGGNKRCEFWAMDLATSKLTKTGEVPCRSRYSFGMSADGKNLYMYGAGFEIDVYDASTFQHKATWDLNNDMTGGMVIIP